MVQPCMVQPLRNAFRCRIMTGHFQQFAAYNRWANARLYAAALALPEEPHRRPTGVFFDSLNGTLNHLLLTDRLWLKRLSGQGEHPYLLNVILYDNRADLTRRDWPKMHD